MTSNRSSSTLKRPTLLLAAGVMLSAAVLFAAHAWGQTPGTGFSGVSGSNSKKPIDIESDRLEVDDKKHLAVFIGNVSATQGDYNLRSRVLEVTYENASQATGQDQAAPSGAKSAKSAKAAVSPAKAADPNATADPLTSGQIKFIHATGGKVLLTSKKDQQEATGDEAFYDVKGQKITMTGEEVILTQKKNIVKGKKLLIDLATGRATVDPDKGRVKAVFEQEGASVSNPLLGDKKKGDTQEKAPAKPTPPNSGWGAQSR
jgi:lipopolysaccharide export system protein LptA